MSSQNGKALGQGSVCLTNPTVQGAGSVCELQEPSQQLESDTDLPDSKPNTLVHGTHCNSQCLEQCRGATSSFFWSLSKTDNFHITLAYPFSPATIQIVATCAANFLGGHPSTGFPFIQAHTCLVFLDDSEGRRTSWHWSQFPAIA